MPDALIRPEPFVPRAAAAELEDLRARLRAVRWPDAPGDVGWALGTDLDYLRELTWPGEIRIETALHRLGSKSIQARQKLFKDEELVARASSVLAVIDLATRRAVPLRNDWRAVLGQWLVPDY